MRSFAQWLRYLEQSHPKQIDLGLERVIEIARRLDLNPAPYSYITIAGTNGKGSTVAALSALLQEAGCSVGAYTSPHLLRFNERIAINDEPVSDDILIDAFERIEAILDGLTLSYFEWATLAACLIFQDQACSFWLMEVGMGGRFDAVNWFEPRLGIITSIDFDHMDYLGRTREAIAFEKAGILRSKTPFICGDPNPPYVLRALGEGGQKSYYLGRDFSDHLPERVLSSLKIAPFNAAIALQAFSHLGYVLSDERIENAFAGIRLRGRQEWFGQGPEICLDVSHNPQGVAYLAETLKHRATKGKTHLLASFLERKEIEAIFPALKGLVDTCHLAPLHEPEGASLSRMERAASVLRVPISCHSDLISAYQRLLATIDRSDRLIVLGSFHTIGQIMQLIV